MGYGRGQVRTVSTLVKVTQQPLVFPRLAGCLVVVMLNR